jgi:hypothetical protein
LDFVEVSTSRDEGIDVGSLKHPTFNQGVAGSRPARPTLDPVTIIGAAQQNLQLLSKSLHSKKQIEEHLQLMLRVSEEQ